MATWGVSLNAVPSRPLPMGRECSMRHVAVAVCSLVLVALILLTTSIATATITQGDFSVYGFSKLARQADGARAARAWTRHRPSWFIQLSVLRSPFLASRSG